MALAAVAAAAAVVAVLAELVREALAVVQDYTAKAAVAQAARVNIQVTGRAAAAAAPGPLATPELAPARWVVWEDIMAAAAAAVELAMAAQELVALVASFGAQPLALACSQAPTSAKLSYGSAP